MIIDNTIWTWNNQGSCTYLSLFLSLSSYRTQLTHVGIEGDFRGANVTTMTIMMQRMTIAITMIILPLLLRIGLGSARDRPKALAMMSVTIEARQWWHLWQWSSLVRTATSFTYRSDINECWRCRFGIRYTVLLMSIDLSKQKNRPSVGALADRFELLSNCAKTLCAFSYSLACIVAFEFAKLSSANFFIQNLSRVRVSSRHDS